MALTDAEALRLYLAMIRLAARADGWFDNAMTVVEVGLTLPPAEMSAIADFETDEARLVSSYLTVEAYSLEHDPENACVEFGTHKIEGGYMTVFRIHYDPELRIPHSVSRVRFRVERGLWAWYRRWRGLPEEFEVADSEVMFTNLPPE